MFSVIWTTEFRARIQSKSKFYESVAFNFRLQQQTAYDITLLRTTNQRTVVRKTYSHGTRILLNQTKAIPKLRNSYNMMISGYWKC
jgi:hypothetical protein